MKCTHLLLVLFYNQVFYCISFRHIRVVALGIAMFISWLIHSKNVSVTIGAISMKFVPYSKNCKNLM